MHQQTTMLYLAGLSLCLHICASEITIVDLTYPLDETTLYWPGVPSFNRSIVSKGYTSSGYWIEIGAFFSGEHGGTHMDVPRHFYSTSIDLAHLPLTDTVLVGVSIDAKAEADADPLYAVTVDKLQQWEETHGQIPNKAGVLINFGWSVRWPDPERFFNSKDLTNGSTFKFPHMTAEAASWLVNERDIKLLGLDVPSPDHPADTTYPAHIALLSKNRLILENVMIPSTLPATGFQLHAAPIKVTGGTGAPTRVYAILSSENNVSSHIYPTIALVIVMIIITLIH